MCNLCKYAQLSLAQSYIIAYVSLCNCYNITFVDNFDFRRCENCSNPAGMAFKLTYHSNKNKEGFFSKLFTVPPKLEFSLPTQFSCQLDAFVFLNNSLSIEALSLKSTCLDLNLGLFPFQNLENIVYIFEECIIEQYCNDVHLNNSANVIVRSYFPKQISNVDMGYFMQMLPVTSSNNLGCVATFTKEGYKLVAKLFNVQISIFNTVIHTTASVNDNELHAKIVMKLYGKYLTDTVITVQQTSSWNEATIMVKGRFLGVAKNIPSMLEHHVKDYLHKLYSRSLVRVRNAEVVFNRCLSQNISATKHHTLISKKKFSTDELLQTTLQDLNNQKGIVNTISNKLNKANDEVQNLKRLIYSVCMIQKCKKICDPYENCTKCVKTVTKAVQGTCEKECCTKRTLYTIIGYRSVFKFGYYIPTPYCSYFYICGWRRCIKVPKCGIKIVFVGVYIKLPVYASKTICVACVVPCIVGIDKTFVTSECCGFVGCSEDEQYYKCANDNKQCHANRKRIYDDLSNEQRTAAELLQALDEENEKEANLKLKVAQLTVRKNDMDKKFVESQDSLSDASMALQLASNVYNRLRNTTNLNMFSKLQVAKKNASSQFDSVKITAVTFDTIIISESPTVLTLIVNGRIQHTGYNFSQIVIVDFNRLEMSLRHAAIEVTRKLIVNEDQYSKRFVKYQRQIAEEDDNYLQFQTRCVDMQNIMEYIKGINQSLETLKNVSTTSINNVAMGRKNLINLINKYTEIYSKPITIEAEKINRAFNNTINITKNIKTEARLSSEESLNLELMKEYLNVSADSNTNMSSKMFITWQNKMEQLHNISSNAAGHKCNGFSDCLQKVTLVLEDILLDTPHSISDKLLQQFTLASQNFIELALIDNSSLELAIQKPRNFFKIANNTELNQYWCSSPPVIIVQPAERINPHEYTNASLSCQVVPDNYTSYKWKKNGNELPNQKNNTLVLKNVQRHDSGNYTCEITNHVGTVKSSVALIEVQQFPWFFLQPENVDVYTDDVNGARFTSNATGWPYPEFRWYFRPKNSKNFTLIPNENENEYLIANPQSQDEGSYYCEAFNEQGSNRSNIVNLNILDVSVLQLSQCLSINFTSFILSDGSGSGNQSIYSGSSLLETSGSGKFDNSGSGIIDNSSSEDISGSGLSINNSTEKIISTYDITLEETIKNTIIDITKVISNTFENISVSNKGNRLSLTFTIYSKKLSYPDVLSDDFIQLNVQARVDWFTAVEKVKEMFTKTSIVFTFSDIIYSSEPNSTKIWPPQYTCPPGKQISSSNNFVCGE